MRENTRSFYQDAASAAVRRITEGLDEALDLVDLASIAAVSPLHFHRIFRGMLGETPLELHRRLRLERAAQQLAASQTSVTIIAFDAGYETHESFTRAFQSAYGFAPTDFRKRLTAHREQMGASGPAPTALRSANGIHFSQLGMPQEIAFNLGELAMEVTVEERPAVRLATISHVGPPNLIGSAFRNLAAIAGSKGLLADPAALMVAVFHDDPEATPAAELRSSAGVIVPETCVLSDHLTELRIEAGMYARATHRGHYAGLSDAWDRLYGRWLPGSGYRVLDKPSYEVYRVADHSRPDDLETDLYIAIELEA
jgi:AraC family transcriptional regulator